MSPTHTSIPISSRLGQFSYAIRNIAVEAQRVEATGKRVRYLNVGNPPAFGFQPPQHMIEAVERAMRDGENGYCPSPGIMPAREAIAREYTTRGWPMTADRVVVTSGTSEAIEIMLAALVDQDGEVLVPLPDYPLYTAVIAKIGARAVHYQTDPDRKWLPDLDHLSRVVTPATRALVVIDPNNPTGATYPKDVRRALIKFATDHGLAIIADEVYGDINYDGPVAPLGSLEPDAPVISVSSLSKGYVAPGWRTGWLAVGRSSKLDELLAAVKKLADGRLCSTVPMQYAIMAALEGDRAHQVSLRSALKERAIVTTRALQSMPGVTCVAPTAAFYVMPKVALPRGKTDIDYVLSLLRATGLLCVHGSGFGTNPADGYLRIVFLASPPELTEIFAQMAAFTASYVA